MEIISIHSSRTVNHSIKLLELKINFQFKKGVGIAIKVKKQVASHLGNN